MLRNYRILLATLGAAILAGAPALHAQAGGAVRGDVDGDGQVTAADARILRDYLVGRPVPPGARVAERGDVNGDGRITAADAAIIAASAAGRDVSRFPVGKALPGDALAVLECNGDVRAGTVECHAPGAASGVRADLIVGGQNQNVKLTSANIAKVAPDTFQFTVTVQNLLKQAMAADSGTGAANANGVRVFFASGPNLTGGPGGSSIALVNHDGLGTFTATNQRYFQYSGADLGGDGILSPNETSAPKTWKMQYTGEPTFSFLVYLSTPMQFPKGWVDIYPPSHAPSPYLVPIDTVQVGNTLQLQDTVRNPFGGVIPGAPVTWSNSANGHATVNGSGLVTALSSGVDTVTATNGPRSGRVAIVVAGLSLDSTTITANPTTIVANDTSLVTVQVKDEFGHNITTGGATVTLTTNLGTLKSTAGTGTTVTANDNGNGTYTAKLTSTTAGTATVTGTLNGNPIVDNATVTIGPSTPATLSIAAGDGQSAAVGAAVAIAPKVHVADQYGNAVPGVTITFAVTGGGGSLGAPTTPVTGATGDASVGSWTLGSGPATNTLQASASPAGSTTPVTFTGYVPPNAVKDSSQAMGNTTLASGLNPSVLNNDGTINGGAVSLVPASIGALTTDRGGTVTLAADGTFSYLPAAGITGRDSVAYSVKDAHYTGPASPSSSSYIKFRFVGKVWYVDNTFGGAATGRDVSPFTGIGAAEAVAGVNDSILVRTGSGTTTGGTLKNGQLVYGQGASSAFTTTINGTGVTLLAAGSPPSIGAMTLGSGNTLRGFTGVGTLTGNNFGTLTVTEVGYSTGATQALSLTTGTLSGGFTSLVSSGGTNNVLLSGVSTSGTSTMGASGNALSAATGDGVVITGGGGSFTFPGNVSNGNAATFAVNVNGKTGGTVTFSGNLNPSVAGQGVSVSGNNTGSNTIVFSGGTKAISSNAAAGVTLTSNTGATIQFTGGGLAIATTTGTPFTATGGGTVEVTGSGNTISATGNAANVVNLNGITLGANGMGFASIASSGTPTGSAFSATSVGNTSGSSFTAGSLTVSATSGASSRGLALTTNSAPFTFTTVTINGTGAEGILLTGNTGAVSVNGGNVGNTTSTTGDALAVSGGNAAITVAANLTKSTAGRIANIGTHSAGAVSVSGSLSCTGSCTGILANGNTGGSITFSNATQTLTTGASAAVSLTSNGGTTIDFTGGSLAITTTSGAGFNATGGGTVTVQGANNTVNSNAGGTAVNVSSTTIGGSGMTFKRVDATGSGTNGIVLSSTGAGAFTVTGDGASDLANTTRGRTTAKSGGGSLGLGSGGTISGRSGDGISLSTTGAVTLRNMVVSGGSSDGIQATSVSGLVIDNTQVTGHTNNRGVSGTSLSGLKIFHSEISNNATSAASAAAVLYNLHLEEVTGTDSVMSSLLQTSYAFAMRVGNTSGTLNLRVENTAITGVTNGIAVGIYPGGTSNVTANFQVDSIGHSSSRGLQSGTTTGSSATYTLTVNNTAFRNNFVAIDNAHGSSGAYTFNITNNNLQTNVASSAQAINVNRLGSSSFSNYGLYSGTISGNTIGTAATANSGSDVGDGINVESNGSGGITRVAILNNVIRQVGQRAIYVAAIDTDIGGGVAPTLEARVQGNDVANMEATALDGVQAVLGALSTDNPTICLNISGNVVASAPRNGIRVRTSGLPSSTPTLRLHGWDGVTAPATYFANLNPSATGLSGNVSYSLGGGSVSSATCTTP